jgi:hypothetical protein
METAAKALRIVIPGGTGQIGQILTRHLSGRGNDVTVLTRNPSGAERDWVPWRTLAWDAEKLGEWTSALEGAEVLISLAGRSVNCRYNAKNRSEILESRVRSTQVLGEAIKRLEQPLPTQLRSRDGRDIGGDWRKGSRCSGEVEIQHRRRHEVGRQFLWRSHTADAEGGVAGRDGDESRSQRHLRPLSAAFVHRTESELLLKSRRVVPRRLVEHGFQFEFPTWPKAARDLVRRVREQTVNAKSRERIQKSLEEARERPT